jgi:hypothetical protein
MATAALHRSPVTERRTVAGWISGGIAILLTGLLGVVAATQLRLAAVLLGEAWFGSGIRAWLR